MCKRCGAQQWTSHALWSCLSRENHLAVKDLLEGQQWKTDEYNDADEEHKALYTCTLHTSAVLETKY